MNLRDKIAGEIIRFWCRPEHQVANAIINAIRESVKPLEWEGGAWHHNNEGGWLEESSDLYWNWYEIKDYRGGYIVRHCTFDGWQSGPFDNPSEAKAAANAHHAALILAALGLEAADTSDIEQTPSDA